jgi:hypothetical protein
MLFDIQKLTSASTLIDIFVSSVILKFYGLCRSIDFIFTFRILLSTLWPVFLSYIDLIQSDLYIMQGLSLIYTTFLLLVLMSGDMDCHWV